MRGIYARQLLELAARRRCFVLPGRRAGGGVYGIYTFYKFYDENFDRMDRMDRMHKQAGNNDSELGVIGVKSKKI